LGQNPSKPIFRPLPEEMESRPRARDSAQALLVDLGHGEFKVCDKTTNFDESKQIIFERNFSWCKPSRQDFLQSRDVCSLNKKGQGAAGSLPSPPANALASPLCTPQA
jgi:hypothetical protein